MVLARQTSYLTEDEIHPLARSLKARAGMLVSTKATKSWGASWSDRCWYFYYEFRAARVQGRGWHRFSPRKREQSRSFARAIVAARRNRVARMKKGR